MNRRLALGTALLLALTGGLVLWGGSAAQHLPVTLLLGLGLLIGMAAGELLGALHLPRILGYLLAGTLIGTQGLSLLDAASLRALQPLWQVSLGLVAFLVGTRVRIADMRRQIGSVTAIQGALCVAVLGAACLFLVRGPAGESGYTVLLVLLCGLALWAPSSAIFAGVVHESGARGPATDVVLGTTVLAENLAILLAVVALAVFGLAEGGARVAAASALLPGTGILWSVAIGMGVGAIVWIAARACLPWEALTMGLALVGGALLCLAVGAPILPALLIAGIAAANLSPVSRRAADDMWSRGWPLLALFFLLIGVSAPIHFDLFPYAILLLALRICVLQVSNVMGAASAGAGPLKGQLRAVGGWAYVGQGATALLIAEAIRSVVPSDATALLVETARWNMVLGPACLRMALARGGQLELTQRPAAPERVAAPIERGMPAIEHPAVAKAFETLSKGLNDAVRDVEESIESPQTEGLIDLVEELRGICMSGLERVERAFAQEADDPHELEELVSEVRIGAARWLRRQVEAQVLAQEARRTEGALIARLSRVDQLIADLPSLTVAPEAGRLDPVAGDSLWVRGLKLSRRVRYGAIRLFGGKSELTRSVPLSDLASFYIGGRAGREMGAAANALAVQRLDLWRKCRILFASFSQIFDRFRDAIRAGTPLDPAELARARQGLAEELDVVTREIRHTAEQLMSRLERRFHELLAECARGALLSGTWELPRRRYPAGRRIVSRQSHINQMRVDQARWNQLLRATAGALTMGLEGELALHRFGTLIGRSARVIRQETLSPLHEYPEEVAEQCQEAVARVTAAFEGHDTAPAQIEGILRAEHTLLEGFISRIAVGELTVTLEPATARRPVDAFFEGIERELADLPDCFVTRANAWDALPIEAPPPEPELIEFPFRELVREVLDDEVRLRVAERQKAVALLIREAVDELTEMTRFLSFNFEAAEKALSPEDGEPDVPFARDAALQGLEQTIERARRLAARGLAKQEEIASDIDRIAAEQARTLRTILDRIDLSEARQRSGLAELGARPSRVEGDDDTADLVTRSLDSLRELGARLWSEGSRSIRRAVGLQVVPQTRLEDLTRVATFERFEEVGIPRSYRRLFETAAFGVEDILAGQEVELAQLQSAVARWREGNPTAVVVVGERGAGRTTLVERALRRFLSGASVHRRRLTGRVTNEGGLARELSTLLFGEATHALPRIHQLLRERPTPRVVVLEEIQHLMLRTHRGLVPLETFFDFLSRSDGSTLWIATVDMAAWRFMDVFLEGKDTFSYVVELAPLTRAETEQLVVRRHQVSGLELEFRLGPRGGEGGSRLSRVPEPLQRQRYFDALYLIGAGHPLMTMFYWLGSIVAFEEGTTVAVSWPAQPSKAWFKRLQPERLFELAAIMLHGSLTEAEFAAVNRVDPERAVSRLHQLNALNLVEALPGQAATYTINSVLYKPLLDGLLQRNLI